MKYPFTKYHLLDMESLKKSRNNIENPFSPFLSGEIKPNKTKNPNTTNRIYNDNRNDNI